jgi:hypothetical protein
MQAINVSLGDTNGVQAVSASIGAVVEEGRSTHEIGLLKGWKHQIFQYIMLFAYQDGRKISSPVSIVRYILLILVSATSKGYGPGRILTRETTIILVRIRFHVISPYT